MNRLHEGILERMEMEKPCISEIVKMMNRFAFAAEATEPGCFFDDYIMSFKKEYGGCERTAETVRLVLEELELEDNDTTTEVPDEDQVSEDDDEENVQEPEKDDEEKKKEQEKKEQEERERLEKERQEAQKREAEAALSAANRILARVKRRSAKKIPFMSAGLVDPAVSFRTNVVPSLKPSHHSEGVKRQRP